MEFALVDDKRLVIYGDERAEAFGDRAKLDEGFCGWIVPRLEFSPDGPKNVLCHGAPLPGRF